MVEIGSRNLGRRWPIGELSRIAIALAREFAATACVSGSNYLAFRAFYELHSRHLQQCIITNEFKTIIKSGNITYKYREIIQINKLRYTNVVGKDKKIVKYGKIKIINKIQQNTIYKRCR